MSFKIDLTGKTVLITGVTSGIGAGIAKMYALANANIAGCALEKQSHPAVKKFIKSVFDETGRYPIYCKADVTDSKQMELFISKIISKFGNIDILASNAGANVYKGVENCNAEDWSYNLDLNLKSHWNLAKLCKPFLEKNGQGVIIINASIHGYHTMPGAFPYNVAKTALLGLVRALTIEWGPSIRTLGVAPGFIDTKLSQDWFHDFPDPDKARKDIENSHPLRRIGSPEEIGGWFVFLSSPYAAFAGGQTYQIDGGLSALLM